MKNIHQIPVCTIPLGEVLQVKREKRNYIYLLIMVFVSGHLLIYIYRLSHCFVWLNSLVMVYIRHLFSGFSWKKKKHLKLNLTANCVLFFTSANVFCFIWCCILIGWFIDVTLTEFGRRLSLVDKALIETVINEQNTRPVWVNSKFRDVDLEPGSTMGLLSCTILTYI